MPNSAYPPAGQSYYPEGLAELPCQYAQTDADTLGLPAPPPTVMVLFLEAAPWKEQSRQQRATGQSLGQDTQQQPQQGWRTISHGVGASLSEWRTAAALLLQWELPQAFSCPRMAWRSTQKARRFRTLACTLIHGPWFSPVDKTGLGSHMDNSPQAGL